MAEYSISQIARELGLRSSAIRYYEDFGILPRARRVSGQRRYSASTLYQLAVVQRAQQAGFTLEEIKRLLCGAPISKRWREIAARKQRELDEKIRQIESMKALLAQMEETCECETVTQCGAGILREPRLPPGS